MSLGGLVGYRGDSEISDSEDERSPQGGDQPPGVVSSGLGIPRKQPEQRLSPVFVRPVVEPAPKIISRKLVGIVPDYEDDEEHDDADDPGRESLYGKLNLPPSEQEEVEVSITEEDDDTSGGENIEEPGVVPLYLPLGDVELPPEPSELCSSALQRKVMELLEKTNTGCNDLLRRKDFRNPSIYERLVEYCGIDELGTNFPKDVFDPHEWTKESFYDQLLVAQKKAHEKKEKARADRAKIEFVSGTKAPVTSSSTSAQDLQKKRKSKWDVTEKGSDSKSSTPGKSGGGGGQVGAQAIANAQQLNKELVKLL